MPKVHLPHLDETDAGPGDAVASAEAARPRWGHRTLWKLALEVLLIAGGVFLGLAGEQWRENTENRELAESSLRRFRTELAANREAVVTVRDYHVSKRKDLADYFATPQEQRRLQSVEINGVRPAFVEHTAWDLALTTQALTPPVDNSEAFLRSVLIYWGDAVIVEPRLVMLYDQLLPSIDRALAP